MTGYREAASIRDDANLLTAGWMTTAKVAERTNRHPVTIRVAAEAGLLHGHQTGRGGRWQFQLAAVDAWVKGQNGEVACGCARRGLKAA